MSQRPRTKVIGRRSRSNVTRVKVISQGHKVKVVGGFV